MAPSFQRKHTWTRVAQATLIVKAQDPSGTSLYLSALRSGAQPGLSG